MSINFYEALKDSSKLKLIKPAMKLSSQLISLQVAVVVIPDQEIQEAENLLSLETTEALTANLEIVSQNLVEVAHDQVVLEDLVAIVLADLVEVVLEDLVAVTPEDLAAIALETLAAIKKQDLKQKHAGKKLNPLQSSLEI